MLLDGSRLDRELMLSVWVIIVMFFLTIRCICDLWLSICDTWLFLVMLEPLWSLVFLGRHPPKGAVLVRFELKELAETYGSRVWLPFHVSSIC